MSSAHADTPALVFEAFIVPHRSLTPRGVCTLIAMLSGLLALVIFRFWLLGAWWVVAFSLIELPIVAMLLALNIRSARASEMILLNTQELTIVHTSAKGRRTVRALPAAWLRIDHEFSNGASRVMLRSRGIGFEIGSFLHEAEKQALYEALGGALHNARNPRFVNSQTP